MNLLRQTVVADDLGVLRVEVPAGRPRLRADVIVTWVEHPPDPEADAATELRNRLAALSIAFPEAHAFVADLRGLCAETRRLHVATSKNLSVHLDYRALLLVDLGRAGAVGIAPAPGGKSGSRDPRSAAIFGSLDKRLAEAGAPPETDDGPRWLTPGVDADAFTDLLQGLRSLLTQPR